MSIFITLEGVEGCGKTTQAGLLAAFLRDRFGCTVALTREPGGTETMRPIRRLLADPNAILDTRAEPLLFLADRAQHVSAFIQPRLARGDIVVCDRYADSTLAYQGYGRGHDLQLLHRLNAWAARDLSPDLTLWIDCNIETGLRRAVSTTAGPGDRFETEPLAFHRRVRGGFVELWHENPARIVRIDGNGTIEDVSTQIKDVVVERLGSRLQHVAGGAQGKA